MDKINQNSTLVLSKEQAAYLIAQMKQVSRSFALVVPNLEPPAERYLMGVAGGATLWQIYASLPETYRDIVR